MRQDAAFRRGEAISQRIIGRLLSGVVDRLVTVNAHLHRATDIRSIFPNIEVDNLSAMPAIAAGLRTVGLEADTVILGPDAESRPWVSDLASRLGVAHAIARKIRHGDRSVEIELADPRLLAGRPVLLVDDIVSSGGTLMACAEALVAAGAASIDVIVTHALFPAELTSKLAGVGVRSLRSTHTVPHPTNAFILDATLAAALRDELGDTGRRETTS
jgi:ribose-phosphate pyrophosphokinase